MKIQVTGNGQNINLVLPTRIIFSKTALRFLNFTGKHHLESALEGLPPDAVNAIFSEMRRIKKKYGCWVLVEVDAAGGDHVKIIL